MPEIYFCSLSAIRECTQPKQQFGWCGTCGIARKELVKKASTVAIDNHAIIDNSDKMIMTITYKTTEGDKHLTVHNGCMEST